MEEPGEVLWSNEYLPAELLNGQRKEIAAFDFFHHRQYIIPVERFVRPAAVCCVRDLDQHTVAVDGELFYIQRPGGGYGYAVVYQPADPFPLRGACGDHLPVSHDLRDGPLCGPVKVAYFTTQSFPLFS